MLNHAGFEYKYPISGNKKIIFKKNHWEKTSSKFLKKDPGFKKAIKLFVIFSGLTINSTI
jgi:hypothetical protein